MNPTIRQLQVFVYVYRSGNLTRAAAQLGLTQSAVSLHLQQLEEVFGLRLFDRTTRALHPTNAATEAIVAAERILVSTSDLAKHMHNIGSASVGRVVFAASAGFASVFLPPVLAKFQKSNPNIDTVFFDVPAQQLVDKLLMTEAEFALGSVQAAIPEVTIEAILKGRLSAIGIDEGAFSAKKQMSWDDLASWPTITMRRETLTRRFIDRSLADFDKSFTPTFEVSLFNTALSMTSHGVGLSVLPDYILPRAQFPALIAKPLVRPALSSQVSLIRRIGRSLSPAAAEFVKLVRSEFARLTGSNS